MGYFGWFVVSTGILVFLASYSDFVYEQRKGWEYYYDLDTDKPKRCIQKGKKRKQ